MGAVLWVEDANLLAYLLTATKIEPDRVLFRSGTVWDSVRRIRDALEYGLLLADEAWTSDLASAAGRAYDAQYDSTTRVQALEALAEQVSKPRLMACTLAASEAGRVSLLDEVRRASLSDLCLLLAGPTDSWNISDPMPPVSLASRELDAWPALVVWSRTGVSAVVSVSALPMLLKELKEIEGSVPADSDLRLVKYDHLLAAVRGRQQPAKVLQLSDLHFGTDEASQHQALLMNHLERVIRNVGRVVITGDLMEHPDERNFWELTACLGRLASLSGSDPITIPGNHDERESYGAFERTLEQVVRLDRQMVEVDDEIQCIFFGFDSSVDAQYAEGSVSVEQLRAAGTRFELLAARRPDIEGFRRIALVHHHPLPFDPEREGLVEYVKEYVSEQVLGMKDGPRFLEWCAKREADLVLHGHKHRPRRRDDVVDVGRGPRPKPVTTVGCATSLGVRGRPLGYNIVTWSNDGDRWSVAFVEGARDGSGFWEIASALRTRQRDR